MESVLDFTAIKRTGDSSTKTKCNPFPLLRFYLLIKLLFDVAGRNFNLNVCGDRTQCRISKNQREKDLVVTQKQGFCLKVYFR